MKNNLRLKDFKDEPVQQANQLQYQLPKQPRNENAKNNDFYDQLKETSISPSKLPGLPADQRALDYSF